MKGIYTKMDDSNYACQNLFENLDLDNAYSNNQYNDIHYLNESRLTVLHAIMRSLVKIFYKLEKLVGLKKTPDIITITETRLDNSKLNKVLFKDISYLMKIQLMLMQVKWDKLEV